MSAQTIAIGPSYDNVDLQVLAVSSVQAALPAPLSPIKGRPEKIFVQAPSSNSVSVFVGKTGLGADGSTGAIEVPAGGNITLPSNDYTLWYARSASGSPKLYVSYFQKVN